MIVYYHCSWVFLESLKGERFFRKIKNLWLWLKLQKALYGSNWSRFWWQISIKKEAFHNMEQILIEKVHIFPYIYWFFFYLIFNWTKINNHDYFVFQICKEEQENQAKLIEKEVKSAVAKVSASYEERLSAARAENSLKIQQGKILSSLSKTSIQNINQHNSGEFVINIIKCCMQMTFLGNTQAFFWTKIWIPFL